MMQDAFENFMDQQARELGGEWYDGKVVGVTHRNADGTERQDIIRSLRERDELELRPEPENPFDKSAIAVFTAVGDQVGYLDKRLAAEITRKLTRGVRTRCFVRIIRTGRETSGLSFGLAESKPVNPLPATKTATK